MKDFISMGTNQVLVRNPQDNVFQLKSEIVINTVEAGYKLHFTEKEENPQVMKTPIVYTQRFYASTGDLIKLRDRLNEEIKLHKKIAKENPE
jgi:hypothetical protein